MDDTLHDGHHECEWAAHCDEYDDVGVAIDLLWSQCEYPVFATFSLHFISCTLVFLERGSGLEEQSTAVHSSREHCFTGSIVIRWMELRTMSLGRCLIKRSF